MTLVVSKEILLKAHLVGLVDNDGDLKELHTAVKFSTPITHRHGRRRYNDYLFTLEGVRLVSIHRVQCHDCLDTKKIEVYNECPKCYGEGCKSCNHGLVLGAIPCPQCTKSKERKQ